MSWELGKSGKGTKKEIVQSRFFSAEGEEKSSGPGRSHGVRGTANSRSVGLLPYRVPGFAEWLASTCSALNKAPEIGEFWHGRETLLLVIATFPFLARLGTSG